MTQSATDAVLDGTLDVIGTSTEMYFCIGEPTTRTEAIAQSVIPAVTMSAGDFTNGPGTPDGRQVDIAAKPGLTADAAGTADHIALSTASALTIVTLSDTPRAVQIGDPLNIAAWRAVNRDPTLI